MNKLISATTAVAYRRVAKPLLFKQKPDVVHERLLRGGAKIQRFRVVRRLLRMSWAYENDSALSQNLLGMTFHNPVGLSAGFDKNFELPPLLKSIGFGLMEGGSLTYHKCKGNPRPWFHRLPKTRSLVVYAGLANKGASQIIKTLKSFPPGTFAGFPLNISVAKTNSKRASNDTDAIADYVGSLRKLKAAGLGDIYTLNISCPNTYGGEPFNTPDRLDRLLTAVDKLQLDKSLFIKMPCDLSWDKFKKLLDITAKHQVAGVTISNLAKDRGQAKLMDPLPDSVKGNLSGKPTWELSNRLIKQTYSGYRDRFVIIGVGGIFSAEDAYQKIKYGASLVELITGLIFEGPQLIGQINEGLVELLERDGHANISQAIGIDAAPCRIEG